MTKVRIDPGICGMIATVTAESEDGMEVVLTVDSPCKGVKSMMEALGSEFDAYEICFTKPGTNPLYEYAAEHFPGHGACPILAGITKCVEAECRLALKKDVSITFIE